MNIDLSRPLGKLQGLLVAVLLVAVTFFVALIVKHAPHAPLESAVRLNTSGIGDVQVEGELGHVGTTSDKDLDEFTTPGDAKTFIEKTGVACLAVAVGTAHGRYKKPPKLDIGRIEEIRRATGGAALVLHGGSGVPDEEIRKGVRAGIRKMNFATDVCYAFLDCCLAELQKPDRPVAVDSFMKVPIEAVKEFCKSRIRLVGADGKVE